MPARPPNWNSIYDKKVGENINLTGKDSQFQLNSKQLTGKNSPFQIKSKQPGQINTVQNGLKRRKTGKLQAVKTVTTDQVSRSISREKRRCATALTLVLIGARFDLIAITSRKRMK